tara:strand:+ start:842 stop:1180 length:339 start_codon:yes stop_codon:yes gene_type:complete
MYGSQMDDNKEIIRNLVWWYPYLDAIVARLAIGVETYGHGVRVNDDTTQWGTKVDSWLEMGLEELDDLAIYVTAQYLREKESLTDDSRHLYDEALKSMGRLRRDLMKLMDDA